ncbi:uncharacterized protein LOC143917726 [Arctopsyche grandis]|uniref:uncharacterized protein LOC143917726 n=1 Tax=Arctopsyche grandis TaxID=121162 RepID=UPI00406D6848
MMGCRLCLDVNAPVDIFEKDEDQLQLQQRQQSLQQCIWNCCQLQVERDDGLPDKLCSLCATKLNSFLLFKIVSKQTDELLRAQLDKKVPIKPEENTFEYPYIIDVKSSQFIPKSEEGTSSTSNVIKLNKFPTFEDLQVENELLFDEPEIKIDKYNNEDANGKFDEFKMTIKNKKSLKSLLKSSKKTDTKKKVRIRISSTSKLKHNCGVCGKNFTTGRSLKDHSLIHLNVKDFKCTECDKTYRRKNDLVVHQSKHFKNEKYKCATCGKILCNSVSLNNHKSTHSESKNYSCEICGRKFRLAKQFKAHMNIIHLKVKPYQCDSCGKLFATREHCRKHAEIHSQVPKYECDYCGKKVNFKHSLLSHFRTHTGERPYKCEYCLKSFGLRKTLNSHILQHTGENPFKCEICLKGFKQKCNLKSHMKYNHKKL